MTANLESADRFQSLREADPEQGPAAGLPRALAAALGERLIAIYSFGSSFGRGEAAPSARRLVLVDRLDAPTIALVAEATAAAREAGTLVRLDTPKDILRGADCFPIFVLELQDTAQLLHGEDVLKDLAIATDQLRLRVEQSLRRLHRELLTVLMDRPGGGEPARTLRRVVRQSLYLLRATALLLETDSSFDPAGADPRFSELIDEVLPRLAATEAGADLALDTTLWHHLRGFAGFEHKPGPKELEVLAGEALTAIDALVEVIDGFPEQGSGPDEAEATD